MGGNISKIGGWIFFLILAYILVSNFKGTTSIGGMFFSGAPKVFASLQGVGPGYPAPAR